MSLWDMLVYVAIIKTTKMMLTNEFNSKDVGVVDVILEINFLIHLMDLSCLNHMRDVTTV